MNNKARSDKNKHADYPQSDFDTMTLLCVLSILTTGRGCRSRRLHALSLRIGCSLHIKPLFSNIGLPSAYIHGLMRLEGYTIASDYRFQ
jgi:hypothetical protein